MESTGKTAVANAPAQTQPSPSIVHLVELSERSDSSPVAVRALGRAQGQALIAGRTSLAYQPDLVPFDRERVDEAAAWIRVKVAATLRHGAEDVGEYVLDSFFSGDPELAKSRNPRKNASFRALADKCGTPELPVSKTWLNNAVGIAVMLRRLPEDGSAFRTLPWSYQETLLPLRDPRRVEMVAEQATKKELSFRELRKVVSTERSREPKLDNRGRPPVPPIIKTLNRSLTLLAIVRSERGISRSEIRALNARQRIAAMSSAKELIGKLNKLVRKLR
jgi:hypothetical protein